jgi:chlorophyll synthase/bacteriochlorophyll c synthase
MMVSTTKQPVPLKKRVLAHIRLTDPVTWISPSLMCLCGVVAAGPGAFSTSRPFDLLLIAVGIIMAGPLATGFSQSINDYFDRDLDAINDPKRPIPSGDVTLKEAQINWIVLATVTTLVGVWLVQVTGRPLILLFTILGLIVGAIYSVPPIKLKKNVWISAPSVGLGYSLMSWLAGHLLFANMTTLSIIMATLNGGITTGLLILNDFKSVEGDRVHGLKSLAVTLGERPALLIGYTFIIISEILMMLLAFAFGYVWFSIVILISIIIPIYSQMKLYQQPNHANFMRFMLASNFFILANQIVSAFVAGGHFA